MALTKYTQDTSIIGQLGTRPEDRPGMTDQQLKDKFDENALTWKEFWNNTASEEIDALIAAIKGAGWTSESLKGLADIITAIKGTGWTNETLKGLADLISAHTGETVAYQTSYTFTSAGGTYSKSVTISLPIAPKSINISACSNGKKTTSNGNWSQNSIQNCMYLNAADTNWRLYPGAVLCLVDASNNSMIATVSAVTTTSITLAFNEFAGSFSGQSIELVITAFAH